MEAQTIAVIANASLSIITLIFAIVRTKGAKNKKTTLIEIIDKIPDIISEAQTLFGANAKSTTAFMNYILTKLQVECITHNISAENSELENRVVKILELQQNKGAISNEKSNNSEENWWKNLHENCKAN